MTAENKQEQIYSRMNEVLKKYYWSRIDSDNDTTPVNDVLEYVKKAWAVGLDKRPECRYAAMKLIFSVLDKTNRRVVDSVDEMNELYKAGLDLATLAWEMQDQVLVKVPTFVRGN